MSILKLNEPSLTQDSFTLLNCLNARKEEFQCIHREVYGGLRPGENATNRLCRGIRWGILLGGSVAEADGRPLGEFHWLGRTSYSLTAEENPEEGGRVRRFGLIPEHYLRRPEVEAMMRLTFQALDFAESPRDRAYEVQLSAIRYEPTLANPAFPSPIRPHHDRIDGAVWVVAKAGPLSGGKTRLYTIDERPLYELELDIGEAIVLRDRAIKHQVSVMQLEPDANWRPGMPSYRDIPIVRYQPMGR